MDKKKIKELCVKDKVDVINYLKNNSLRNTAEKFGISKSTVGNIKARKTEYLQRFEEENSNMQRKRPKTNFNEVNTKTFEWFKQMRAANARISGPMLQECAKGIATKLGIPEFKGSNGWLEKFRTRYGIQHKTLCGEANEVSENDANEFHNTFSSFVEGYEEKDWFNADELGLFFKLMPDKSLVLKGEKCNSGKLSKERLTVLLCASAAGEKLEPLVIGKSKKPRAFRNLKIEDLPVTWRSNKSAWMTSAIFEEWVRSIDLSMRKNNRKILLAVDNCPAHTDVKGLTNVKLKFLPPRMTSRIQPLDQGIIKNFKSIYRNNILKKVVVTLEHVGNSEMTAADVSKCINVLDCVTWIHDSWKTVSTDCIKNCFKKAGFSTLPTENVDLEEIEEIVVPEHVLGVTTETFGEFVSMDDALSTCCEPNQDAIIQSIMDNVTDDVEDIESDIEEEEPVSTEEAVRSLQTLKKFALNTVPSMFNEVANLERKLDNHILFAKSKKQTSITDFFKN